MNKQLLKAGAVAAAMLPVAGFAAIDDQGMQYVSAAEGLHGSLRVDVLISRDDDANATDNDTLSGGAQNDLRLWYIGHSDLGGGLSSTYYWEIRSEEPRDERGVIETHAWDLGLVGPWGEAKVGRLAMTAYRLVPSASLAFERGSERGSPGADPGDNGLRYETPTINGFKFGVSGRIENQEVNGTYTTVETLTDSNGDTIDVTLNVTVPVDANDDAIDEYSFAVSYDSPIGLQLGVGYEVVSLVDNPTDITVNGNEVMFDPIQDGEMGTGPTATPIIVGDDQEGWRFGARYSQDNWLVGYEYRTYDGYWNYNSGTNVQFDANGTVADGAVEDVPVNWNKNAEYEVHAVGVQVKIDRITATANYSIETQTLDSVNPAIMNVADRKATELDREVIAIDAAYSLGSRSTMVIGWVSTETDNFGTVTDAQAMSGAAHGGFASGARIANNGSKETIDVSEVYLFYRVDF